jgi:hypothetical protein
MPPLKRLESDVPLRVFAQSCGPMNLGRMDGECVRPHMGWTRPPALDDFLL